MRPKLTAEQLERAIELQRNCWTHQRIALELGVCRETITRALARLNRRALKRLERRAASIKAQQISQLEWMTDESVQAWERSKRDAETVKTTEEGPQVGGAGAGTGSFVMETKTETTVKGQVGDAGYLSQARAAMGDIRKILGIEARETLAARKHEHATRPPEAPDDDYAIDLAPPDDPPHEADGPAA